jgi:PAS domain S-box-containing protein
MKTIIESLGKPEIETVVAQLRAEIGGAPLAADAELQDIITMMPVALFIKDAQSRFVLMNPACEAMWGVRFSEMRGTDGSALFPEQTPGYIAQDRAAFAAHRHLVNEELLWHKGMGENRWLQTYKQPTYDEQGRPRLLIAMCIDITERKRAERTMMNSMKQLRALSTHQRRAKDNERRRIAKEVHDDLAQNLLALKLDVSALHARTGQQQPLLHQRAAQSLATLDACIVAVRDLINELHPSTLELGLSAAVEWQLQQLEHRHGLSCRLKVLNDNAALDQRQTSAIFHIAQAALDYVGSHAGVREVQATLNLEPDKLSIIISGDGLPDRRKVSGALELRAIRERLVDFGGELAVANLAGAGTVLSMTLPVTSVPE